MQIDLINTQNSEAPYMGISLTLGTVDELLHAGQTTEGTVIFASGNRVNIRLTDRTILRARLSEGVILAEGDRVWLSVREKNAASMVMELLEVIGENPDSPENMGTALKKAGIPNNKLNIEIAAALKEYGLEIKAEIIEKTTAVLEKYPKASIIAAVFAVANDIEIDMTSMGIVSALEESSYKAHSSLTGIFRLLSGMTEQNINGSLNPVQTVINKSDLDTVAANEEFGRLSPRPDDALKRLMDEGFDSIKGSGFDLEGELEKVFFAGTSGPEAAGQIKAAGEKLVFHLQLLRTCCLKQRQGGGKDVLREIDKLLQSLKLFSSLERLSYMQIPIIIADKRETLELYMLKKDAGARPTEPGAIKILIALDTQNLGRVEALVGIRDGSISIDFKLAEEKAAECFREGAGALYGQASLKGYKILSLRFQTFSEPVTPVNAHEILSGGDHEGSTNINIRV